MNETKLKLARDFLEMANRDTISTGDLKKAVQTILGLIKDVKISLDNDNRDLKEEVTANDRQLYSYCKKIEGDIAELFEKYNKNNGSEIKSLQKKLSQEITRVISLIPSVTYLENEISLLEKKIPIVEIQTPELIRDKLETLRGDDRLDKSAIRGLNDLDKKIEEVSLLAKKYTGNHGGASGRINFIQDDGVTVAKHVDALNFTGATLTVSADGIVSIPVGGGSGSNSDIELPTGSSSGAGLGDGSTLAFTIAYVPLWVTINGISYYENYGWTRSSATLSIDSSITPANGAVIRSHHNSVAVSGSSHLTDDSGNILTDDSGNQLTPN